MAGLNRNASLREVDMLPVKGEELALNDDQLRGVYRVREVHAPNSKLNPGEEWVVTLDKVRNL